MNDFTRLREVALESRLWRTWMAIAGAAQSAWMDSVTGRVEAALVDDIREWTTTERFQHCAIAIATALAVYTVGLATLPRYVISGVPIAVFALFAFAALGVALFAAPIAAALPHSRLAVNGQGHRDSEPQRNSF